MGGLQCAVYLQAGTGMAHVSLNASDTPNSLPDTGGVSDSHGGTLDNISTF